MEKTGVGDGMSMTDIIPKIRQEIPALIGLKLNNVVGLAKTEDGWRVMVEMVEKESIPNSMDLLGLYEITLDGEGTILGFERKSLRKRVDVETPKP